MKTTIIFFTYNNINEQLKNGFYWQYYIEKLYEENGELKFTPLTVATGQVVCESQP